MRISAILLAVCLTASALAGDKPYAFGRFGFNNDDGLLTMNVTPGGFRLPPLCAPFGATWPTAGAARVSRLDATEKVLLLPRTPQGPSQLRYSLLSPALEAKFGRVATISFHTPGQSSLSVDGGIPKRPDGEWIHPLTSDLVLAPDGGTPVIVTITPRPRRLYVAGVQSLPTFEYAIYVEADRPLTIRFTVPSLQKRTLPDVASVRRFLRLVDTHQPIPRLLRETYRLDRKAGIVTVTDTYTPADARILLPSMMAFAASHQYPMKPIGAGLLFCKYGPLVFGGRNGKVSYTLPVPPTAERGYLAPAKGDDLLPLLNEVCGHWPAAWCRNSVDLGYAGVTNAAMAWNLLTHDNKVKAREAWKTYLDSAFALPPYKPSPNPSRAEWNRPPPRLGGGLKPWQTMTEPFSGRSFLWGYSINNKVRQCDLEWGIGLPLYGLYKFGTVTGDWSRVKRLWPSAKRLAGYFDVADDYAWMTVCNAEDGYSTGAGDALNAAYAGMVAMLGIARQIGDVEAEAKYSYRLARVALLTTMRPEYTKWGRAHGMVDADEAALGFLEKSSFTTSSYRADPWGVTTLLSGDGCMPEIAQLYAWSQPSAWKGFLDEYARFYPDWFDADHKYNVDVTYNGNSGYVTYAHLFARTWFGAGQEDLRRWLAAAQSNRNNAWVGPNAIAEIITREAPVVLSSWGSAPIPSGTYTQNSAVVKINAPKKTVLWLEPRRNVLSVRRNGRPTSFVLEDRATGPAVGVEIPAGSHTISLNFD